MANYWAHSANRAGNKHPLLSHLRAVAELARAFLENTDLQEEGALAGLLHDIGKYGDLFQQRLLDPAHIKGLDHWSAGAWIAIRKYRALAAAFAIQGHHIGLTAWQDMLRIRPEELENRHPLNLRLTDPDADRLLSRLLGDGLEPAKPLTPLITAKPGNTLKNLAEMLNVRRLFSALVDADFLDTEAHFQGSGEGKAYRPGGQALQAEQSLTILLDAIAKLGRKSDAPSHINRIRSDLLGDCLRAAERQPGLFTLTAPTGSGKTLAMLAFALKHAQWHGLRRIVLVIPYLTIIEQTAAIYRDLFESRFGADYVLEHHSMAGFGAEDNEEDSEVEAERRRRLLAENWDAPIIVTTSVQFLESLFSNRPSSCRKLHRLAGSVILFDEVQTLPVSLAVPTLAALSHLSREWKSSVVFSTATQPAFEHLDREVREYVPSGWQPEEIVRQPQQMTERLRRVVYRFPSRGETTDWATLADRIAEYEQGLCIVNLKRHARQIYQSFSEEDDSCYHLSTNLCPMHRRRVLEEVREKLNDSRRCRLVATQCVEAGVDVDFPKVWRAMGPLDAIIQAAGRCNRHGNREQGEMTVFVPEESPYPPMPGYLQATKVTESLLNSIGRESFDPYDGGLIRRYYQSLYQISDPAGQKADLIEAIMGFDFPEVARQYRLISQDTINIVVPWTPAKPLYDELRELAENEGLNRRWIQHARPLSVGLYRPNSDDSIWDALMPVPYFRGGKKTPGKEDWFIYLREEDYHDELGLIPPDNLHLWIA